MNTSTSASHLSHPETQLAVDRRGHVYVGDTLRGKIKKVLCGLGLRLRVWVRNRASNLISARVRLSPTRPTNISLWEGGDGEKLKC
eukprot:1203290-Amorphochlora_amoeboformis.AAC.2